MSAFRRVDARKAGPEALGILVPPGTTSVVILRPRSLEWDLLPLAPGLEHVQPAVFATCGRDAAAGLARRVQLALESAVGREPHPLEVVCSAPDVAYGVCARIEGRLWIVCGRAGGQAYQPLLCPSPVEADGVVQRLLPYLWPKAGSGREYYFNTQAFSS
jgi:hypothetical protein